MVSHNPRYVKYYAVLTRFYRDSYSLPTLTLRQSSTMTIAVLFQIGRRLPAGSGSLVASGDREKNDREPCCRADEADDVRRSGVGEHCTEAGAKASNDQANCWEPRWDCIGFTADHLDHEHTGCDHEPSEDRFEPALISFDVLFHIFRFLRGRRRLLLLFSDRQTVDGQPGAQARLQRLHAHGWRPGAGARRLLAIPASGPG